jgi:WD40 repeat protein
VWGVSFSADGRVLASGSHDNTVRLWDPATGACTRTLEGHTDSVWGVSFSADGRVLASGSRDNTVRLWDPATGACLATLIQGEGGWVARTPEGKYRWGGAPIRSFWFAVNLCRYEPGELDELMPELLLRDERFM